MATQQQIKDAIYNTTNGTFDFDYVDILEKVINRVDDYNNEEDIAEAIDRAYDFYSDIWVIAKHFYANPLEFNPGEMSDYFSGDVYAVCKKLANAKKEQ